MPKQKRNGTSRPEEDPQDANPLHKRLPAEVVSRRRPMQAAAASEKEGISATTDIKQVLLLKAEQRVKWLQKALQHAQDGKIEPTVLYDVIASQKFVHELNEKTGNRMYRLVHAKLEVFSTKQRRSLENECALAVQYAKTAWAKNEEAAEKAEASANRMEDMMARCRAFVREQQQQRGEREAGDGGPEGSQVRPAPADSPSNSPPPARVAPAATAAGAARAEEPRPPQQREEEPAQEKGDQKRNRKRKHSESREKKRKRSSSSDGRGRGKKSSRVKKKGGRKRSRSPSSAPSSYSSASVPARRARGHDRGRIRS